MQQTRVWDTPETLFSHALRIYPSSVTARAALAKIQRDQGRYQDAFETLRGGLVYGDNVYLSLGAAFIYARTGQIMEARDQFHKAMSLDPQNPEPVFSLGSLEEQTGNTAAAKDLYVRAITLDPSYVVARTNLGALLRVEGKNDEAEAQFREALAWNPSAIDAYLGLGRILFKRGEHDEARALVDKALQVQPDHREAVSLRAAMEEPPK